MNGLLFTAKKSDKGASNLLATWRENKFMEHDQKKRGKEVSLIMASNHLGNEDDLPLRSKEALQNSDLVVFEEARPARKALKASGVKREFLLFNEHAQKDTLEEVRRALKKGQTVCYMSDQGSPTFCDPGAELAATAHELEKEIQVIPGPSSLTAAMSACPFPINGFVFTGLLPRKKEERLAELKKYLSLKKPLITLDAPYRREALLESFEDLVGGKQKALLALDISGPEESYLYGSLKEIRKKTKSLGKINFVLILKP